MKTSSFFSRKFLSKFKVVKPPRESKILNFNNLLVFALLITPLSAWSYTATIQRFHLVGASQDGAMIAILLSHFGPSSHAPFANVEVWRVGEKKPVYFNSKSMLQGGESELHQLEQTVLAESTPSLTKLGVKVGNNSNVFKVPAEWSQDASNSSLLRGALDLQNNASLLDFGLQKMQANDCQGLSWRICMLSNRSCYSPVVPRKEDVCITKDISLSEIYKVGSTLWFIARLKMIPFTDLDSYFVDLIGVPVSH